MQKTIAIIVLIILILCSGCFTEKAYSGRTIGLFEAVESISLKDSTKIILNTPVVITDDELRNNLIIRTSKDFKILRIPKEQVNSVYSRRYSRGYFLKSRRLGWMYLLH